MNAQEFAKLANSLTAQRGARSYSRSEQESIRSFRFIADANGTTVRVTAKGAFRYLAGEIIREAAPTATVSLTAYGYQVEL
jgi:hypothetical protein